MAETPEPVTGVLRSDVELIRGNPPLLFDRQADAYYKVAPEMLNILAYLTESIPVSQFREKLNRNGVSVDRETLLKLLAFLQQNNLLAPEYGHIGIKRERQGPTGGKNGGTESETPFWRRSGRMSPGSPPNGSCGCWRFLP